MADKPKKPNKPVSFATDIRPLFTQMDIDHMSGFFDLSSFDDVKTNAPLILTRLQATSNDQVMPPPPDRGGDGPWTADKIALFQSWIDGGFQP